MVFGGVVSQQFLIGAGKPLLVGRNLLLIGALLALTACSLLNSEPTLGDTTDLQGQAIVTCSTACAERGQCGTAVDGSRVVLGGQGGPTVENHDMVFAVDTAVPIYEMRIQQVETLATAQQFNLRFYHIQRPDGLNGWVSGWCLAAE